MTKLNWKHKITRSEFMIERVCTSANHPNYKAIVTIEYRPTKGGRSKKQWAFDVLIVETLNYFADLESGWGIAANRFKTKKELTSYLKEFFSDPKTTIKKYYNCEDSEGMSSKYFVEEIKYMEERIKRRKEKYQKMKNHKGLLHLNRTRLQGSKLLISFLKENPNWTEKKENKYEKDYTQWDYV